MFLWYGGLSSDITATVPPAGQKSFHVNYLEELGIISAQFCPAPHLERSEEGNSMSGMFLYKRLLEYHRSCQQIIQNLFARRSVMTRQYSMIFSILCPLEEKECSVAGSAAKGGTNG
jgi:hypothetical protein